MNKEQKYNLEMAKYNLEAIESVRARASMAMNSGDYITYANLMGDLIALEDSLTATTQVLVKSLSNKAA